MKKNYVIMVFLNMIIFSYSQNWSMQIINISNSQIPSNNVRSITLDNKKQLWVGTTDGIGVFSNNTWSKVLVNNREYNNNIAKLWSIGDSLWVGTEYNGLWKFANNKWKNYDSNTSGNGIRGFAIGKNDTIFRLDKFGEFDRWSGTSWTQIISFVDHPEFLYSDSKKNIWVGSGNLGLYKYNNSKIFQFRNNFSDVNAINYIPPADLRCMVEDSNGNLWVGTYDKGLLKYDGNKWKVVSTPSNANVLDIDIDKNNSLWLATDLGIIRYFNNEWLVFNTSNSSLPDNRVTSIRIENENKIWAAVGYNDLYSPPGGKGIVCLNNKLSEIKTISTIDCKVFPNPTKGSIMVSLNNISLDKAKVSITGLNGNLLYNNYIENNASTFKIDLSNYENGIYFINFQSETMNIKAKIIKN